MSVRRRLNSRVLKLFLSCLTLLSCFPGFISSAIVKLDSIEIFETHEWLPTGPTVYFQCKGENMTVLPDVKKAHVFYAFKGEESWQPLVELPNKKCKRCGFYEKDIIKPDDVFDEWELCPSDFTDSNGKYMHLKINELNATFICPECVPLGNDSGHASDSHDGRNGMHWVVIIVISALVSTIVILGLIAGYKYWQKRKREKEQARFLKLFEDGDDIEDELGIGPLSSVI